MQTTMTLILTVALAVVIIPARAHAQTAPYDPRVTFTETDLNQDGVIDHAEFQERLSFVFYRADTNKGGFLDPIELKQLVFPEEFTADDKDKDGRVSMREFLRVRFHDFDVADTNHDGVLSDDEVVAAFEGTKQR